jgi:hypothetical protein
VKPNINSVEVHPQLNNNRHPVDGALVSEPALCFMLEMLLCEEGSPLLSKYVTNANANKQGGVSHCGLAIYIKKYLKAKEEELWKLKYFTMQKL